MMCGYNKHGTEQNQNYPQNPPKVGHIFRANKVNGDWYLKGQEGNVGSIHNIAAMGMHIQMGGEFMLS